MIGNGLAQGGKREAENAYPSMRGTLVPEDLFDEVLRLRDQFRVAAES